MLITAIISVDCEGVPEDTVLNEAGHIGKDEGPILESDFLQDAGVSAGHVSYFLRVFIQAADSFREFLNEAGG